MKYFDDSERSIISTENIQGALPVFNDYAIDNDILKPCMIKGLGKLYFPFLHKEMPHHFARLYEGDNSNIINFAKSYGMLGRELLVASQIYDPNKRKGYPETVEWIKAHSKSVHICLSIINHLKQFPHDSSVNYENPPLNEYLSQFLLNGNTYHLVNVGNTYEIQSITFGKEIDLYKDAIRILQELINCNLCHFYRSIELQANGNISNNYNFTALIEVIYWILADTVVNGHVKQCEECGRVFIQTDKRQRYCPIMREAKELHSNLKDSTCAIRHRVRTWRKNHETT
jgi:hypothetical protein